MPNEWFEEARATYPDITKGLEDFTYYNNADCNYYGTYPSFIHILTGNPLDLSLSVNDYLNKVGTMRKRMHILIFYIVIIIR